MKIELTEEAKIWRDTHIEISIPETAEECFEGLGSIVGCNAPNLNNGVADIDRLIQPIKDSLRERIEELTKEYPDHYSALEVNLEELIKNVHVTLITEKDSTNPKTQIRVRNYFKWKSDGLWSNNFEYTPTPDEYPKDKEKADCENLLGVYRPQYGDICLWIDKIMRHVNPEVVFQKVLLHEMIHALFDIQPRAYEQGANGDWTIKAIGSEIEDNDKKREETLDNTLVLRAYSDKGEKIYKFVEDFIKNQPPEYSYATSEFAKGEDYYSAEILKHLHRKVEQAELQTLTTDGIYYGFDYVIDDAQQPTPEEEWEKIKINWGNLKEFLDSCNGLPEPILLCTTDENEAIIYEWEQKHSAKSNRIVCSLSKKYSMICLSYNDNLLYKSADDTFYQFRTKRPLFNEELHIIKDKELAMLISLAICLINPDASICWQDLYQPEDGLS